MALTKAQIQTKINQYLIENTTGSITASQIKELLLDILLAYQQEGGSITVADSMALEGLTLAQVINEVISNLGQQVFFTSGFIDNSQIPPSITRDSELAAAVAALVDSSPNTLNTLNELAAALGNDPNFATTILASIGAKIDKFNFVHAPKSNIAAADSDNPTAAEIKVWNDTFENPHQNKVIYYNNSDNSSVLTTYAFWVDNSAIVIKISQPNQEKSDWNASSGVTQIQNKPTTFPPENHGHSLAEVSGLIAALSLKLDKFNFAFISSANITPIVVGYPSVSEVTAYCTGNSLKNLYVYYNQTITSSNIPTHLWYVDNSGLVIKVFGGKKTIYIPTMDFDLVAGTVPTTTAATKSLLTTTGVNAISLSGAASNSFAFTFQIPEDYNSSGSLVMCYTVPAAATGNFVVSTIQTQSQLGNNYSVIDGTNNTGAVAMTIAANSPVLEREIPLVVAALSGAIYTVRVYRDSANALDTSSQALLITGFKFLYQ